MTLKYKIYIAAVGVVLVVFASYSAASHFQIKRQEAEIEYAKTKADSFQQIAVSKDDKGRYQLSVIAGDRPGLLARIAHILAQNHVVISSAKINTLGARAEDTFWISGTTLEQPQAVESLRLELQKVLK